MPLVSFMIVVAMSMPVWSAGLQQAPTAPDDGKREFVVSGCLLRNGYAGYLVDDGRVVAIDGKRVPEPAPAAAPAMPKKWVLDGSGNLGPRVGERVEVTGRTDWQPPSSSSASTDEPPDRPPHLDVKSVKTMASSCT